MLRSDVNADALCVIMWTV